MSGTAFVIGPAAIVFAANARHAVERSSLEALERAFIVVADVEGKGIRESFKARDRCGHMLEMHSGLSDFIQFTARR